MKNSNIVIKKTKKNGMIAKPAKTPGKEAKAITKEAKICNKV